MCIYIIDDDARELGINNRNYSNWDATEAATVLARFARHRWSLVSSMVDDITCIVVKLNDISSSSPHNHNTTTTTTTTTVNGGGGGSSANEDDDDAYAFEVEVEEEEDEEEEEEEE